MPISEATDGILEGSGVKGHQSERRNQLDYLELTKDGQVPREKILIRRRTG